MIGREWERRKAWSGPALIRRGPDFFKESWRIEDEPRVLYAKCEALYVPIMPKADFLLFSFEECNISSHIRRRWLGGPPVPIPNTEVKHPYAESTWLETAREARELPV